jgi:hypothetical protein
MVRSSFFSETVGYSRTASGATESGKRSGAFSSPGNQAGLPMSRYCEVHESWKADPEEFWANAAAAVHTQTSAEGHSAT